MKGHKDSFFSVSCWGLYVLNFLQTKLPQNGKCFSMFGNQIEKMDFSGKDIDEENRIVYS